MGIPTMVITRVGFSQAVANAYAGIGLPAEAPTVFEFPYEMFLAESDLSPLRENIDKIIYGLTEWEPTTKEKGTYAPPRVTVEGKDYQEAVDNMNKLFLRKLWGDGLPLVPATEERVNWILTGTDLPRDQVVGKILPLGRVATVEALAISLAMAGGRPEYLPVLIATVEAILVPEMQLKGWNTTTGAGTPVVIVNGPIAKQIRLNSGYGLLGPRAEYPAGGPIGRALRFILQNLGGAIPAMGTMSDYGMPGRYTNHVFAEDEDGLPAGWEPLNVERGSPQGSNTVTVGVVYSAGSVGHIPFRGEDSEAIIRRILNRYIVTMQGDYWDYWFSPFTPEAAPGIVFMGRGLASDLAKAGWTKEEVKTYLWENSKIPWSELERVRSPEDLEMMMSINEYNSANLLPGQSWPIAISPENIIIVVAGGDQSGHGFYMGIQWIKTIPTKEIELPANWDTLLEQAEDDLGPLPIRH